ncbi:MAG TPA: inositol monophosphatase family protein [Anaerolineae bacterium]|jgi:myo-inositol-1(or 4)-monophosphatase
MELDQFWAQVFSEDAAKVRDAWNWLTVDERVSLRAHLTQIVHDHERAMIQREAARFALRVLDIPAFTLPDGALEFARQLAHQTGERLKVSSGQLIATTKQDGTLVTTSDIEADQHVAEAIASRYPEHAILSEEGDKVYRGQEWCWVIDPIDGTTNFTWGFPAWGVLIALLYKGEPVLGVADFPPAGQQLYAVRGQGAWRKTDSGQGDGAIRAARDETFTSTQLFAVGTRSLKPDAPMLPCKLRLPGSTGFDFALLASGACVGVYDSVVHVWDIAALWPIVEESGGMIVTNRPGGVFPLQAGVDYYTVEFAALGAASTGILSESLVRLSDRFTAA